MKNICTLIPQLRKSCDKGKKLELGAPYNPIIFKAFVKKEGITETKGNAGEIRRYMQLKRSYNSLSPIEQTKLKNSYTKSCGEYITSLNIK